MKMEEMKKQLREIAEIAKKQHEGPYTPQSDAMMALARSRKKRLWINRASMRNFC